MTHLKYVRMISDLISASPAAIFTQITNSLFYTYVYPVSDTYAIVKPLLNAGKDRDEVSSHGPLYNTCFLRKVRKPYVFNLMII